MRQNMDYYIDKDGNIYTGDLQPGDRLATPEEVYAHQNPPRTAQQIHSELDALDNQAVRPLRAIANGTATNFDIQKLSELEMQAALLRAELATLVT